MEYKVKYKLDITILERSCGDGKSPQEIPDKKNVKEKPLGKMCIISGSQEKIKKELCKQIDKLTEDLEKWYFGSEEE